MLNGQITTHEDTGEKFIFVLASGVPQPLQAHESHPNWKRITEKFLAGDEDGFAELFDIPKAIERGFERLSERVAVKGDQILFDGDPVHGTIVDAILSMLDAGEDFEPLVKFYEKLITNPLGDVREGVYDWIVGQKSEGNFTITDEGNILGYKSVRSSAPTWRTDALTVYRPSRTGEGIVNGREVAADEYIEQLPGDIVEMPRSRVLHAPSRECADGLHIGTWNYAKGFTGDTVLLVEFNPRDIVSVPDSNSSWKLRVCRYYVHGPVTEPLEAPVYHVPSREPEPTDEGDLDVEVGGSVFDFTVGDRVRDEEGDEGEVVALDSDEGEVKVAYDEYSPDWVPAEYLAKVEASEPVGKLRKGDRVKDWQGDEATVVNAVDENGRVKIRWDNSRFGDKNNEGSLWADGLFPITESGETATGRGSDGRLHGKGGPTSQAAKGRGRNPAQDTKGRFSAGRPGSRRDPNTGRFA